MGLFDLVTNVVKIGVDVVSLPITIVDKTVVKPISDATRAIREEIEDLLD